MARPTKTALFERYARPIEKKLAEYWLQHSMPMAYRYLIPSQTGPVPREQRDAFIEWLIDTKRIHVVMLEKSGARYCFPHLQTFKIDAELIELAIEAVKRRLRKEAAENKALRRTLTRRLLAGIDDESSAV